MNRRPHDQYFTPASACEVLKAHWSKWKRAGILLEPCVGMGGIVDCFPDENWFTCDIDSEVQPNRVADMTHWSNWIAIDYWTRHDCVITNPPFNCALGILKNAHRACTRVAMLLRLSFLEPTRERGPWLAANPPDLVIVLPRISFTGDGKTDSVTCAWMIWDKTIEQKGVIVSPRP